MAGRLLELLHKSALLRRRRGTRAAVALPVAPRSGAVAADSDAVNVPMPMHGDWAWRPELWCHQVRPAELVQVASKTPFGHEARVFHDCDLNDVSVGQTTAETTEPAAPFGVRLDVGRFNGSFLSLAIELPDAAIRGLTRRHIVSFETRLHSAVSVQAFARLNVAHGPNTEKLVLALSGPAETRVAEFDMTLSRLNESRVDRAWLDIIFETPQMAQISILDATMNRRPRAAF